MRRGRLGLLALVLCIVAGISPVNAATASGVLDAGGQSQWISCAGAGRPTIVIVSGLGADHRMWSKVLGPTRGVSRVCISDRPGLGLSPARRGSLWTDAGEHAEELDALLTAAGEKGPYILVGHSYGGLVVRAFAAQHRDEVAGVMLVEAVYPGIHRTFLPSYAGPWHEGGTLINMDASERATAGGPNLGSTPLVVITAGRPGNGSSWADAQWNAEQAKSARLSTQSVHWFARQSGHVVQRDQPAIVITGVRWLVDRARQREHRLRHQP